MNCIIVEDEYPAREELKYFINKFSDISILEEFDNSLDALDFLKSNLTDVIFLDINMPGVNGISMAKITKKLRNSPKFVFITAYPEYAVDAFEIEAFDYILKPYSEERIISTLKKLERNSEDEERSNGKVALKDGGKIVLKNKNDIYFCKANGKDTLVYTKDQVYKTNIGISEYLKILNDSNFLRTHKSYIVNINKIKEIIPWFNNTYNIKFEDIKEEAYVSKNFIKNFKNKLSIK
ncbi:LytTR family transcriptional regulator [Petrotoga mexicana DSM 14811]|uniref:LytTR family transcriptional regulator n=1 Tax=Petrotoga mexicana DSM 14811 TaxID=1122954 RepID=A0A2K1P5U0_9BACT|nr:LytTR family DNA-binding domain-containing protein [Petrotoga mexicana]PNR98158.1 LytTR family transcriptional regulator [Petrotoga mexicana DSM 14811]